MEQAEAEYLRGAVRLCDLGYGETQAQSQDYSECSDVL